MYQETNHVIPVEKLINVHECEVDGATNQWAVCHWNEIIGKFQRPLDHDERRINNYRFHAEAANTAEYFAIFNTEAEARARARTLYSYSRKV